MLISPYKKPYQRKAKQTFGKVSHKKFVKKSWTNLAIVNYLFFF